MFGPVSDPNVAYIVLVVFFATLIRSTFGFGEALFAVPLLALRLPVTVAAPLAALLSVLIAGVVVAQDWRHVQVRSALGFILSALPGIPLGTLLLVKGNDHLVKTVLGLTIVAFSIYSLSVRSRPHLAHDHRGWLLGCGFLSGVFGGAYGMNGPPLVVYGSLRRWSPQHFRATLQGYFLPASLAGVIGYLAIGLWSAAVTRYFLLSLPSMAVAIPIGRALNRRLTGDRFLRAIHAGLILVGLTLLYQAR